MFSTKFIGAGYDYTKYQHHVPSPLFRKSFSLDPSVHKVTLVIAGLGFYDAFVNGTRITKGLLAPYINNPDDIVYYDSYDITPLLDKENVLGIQLGNGMQNSFDGTIWDFDKAKYRGAPRVAFSLEFEYADGHTELVEADPSVKTSASPILWDGLRSGIGYDARLEQSGWNLPGFDDSSWKESVWMETPRGEAQICKAEPVLPRSELKPVAITPCHMADYTPRGDVPREENPVMLKTRDGYLYDFGVNIAGVIKLKIKGEKGQQIDLQFAEYINPQGEMDYSNINFYPDGYSQRDVYICKGEGTEVFVPQFTYHGFRYCMVLGITPEQATEDLLSTYVCHTDMPTIGGFQCSDEVANKLEEMTIRADLSNFVYFPTDCPHREKNGWTGDAAASCEHMLLHFDAGNSLRVWLDNVRRTMKANGELPGIIPTGGWGYAWGNGPAWDAAQIWIPYYVYTLSGDVGILADNADAIFRYVDYIYHHRTARGTVELGLGDWVPVTVIKSPLEFTDSVISMCNMKRAAFIFEVLGQTDRKIYAEKLHEEIRNAVRLHLVDLHTMTAIGRCQTSQAMGLYYGLFEPGEEAMAMKVLLETIHEAKDHIDCGFLGVRVLFRVLADHGETDLAYRMITRPDYPSYGNFVTRGLTTLPEDFRREEAAPASLNHHFLGDISAFFMEYIAGLRINPTGKDLTEIDVRPFFVEGMKDAAAYHDFADGRVICGWTKTEEGYVIMISKAPSQHGKIHLPKGYKFKKEQTTFRNLENGEFEIIKV